MIKVSFFSYKGGSGRSSALVNTIPFLVDVLKADSNKPIVLLDMDIDSTGLTYLLQQGENVGADSLTVQRIMIDGVPGGNMFLPRMEEHPFFSKLLKVGDKFNREKGSVLLLPAAAGVSVGRDGTNMNLSNKDTGRIQRVVDVCDRYDCSAVVFDSSAGDQDTANVSNSTADVIVCCMRPTTQFQEGTLDYFKRMNQTVRNRNVVLLPNAVSKENTTVDGKAYPITAKNRIVEVFRNALQETGNHFHFDTLYGADFGVPLVGRFLWKESILATLDEQTLAQDEKDALEMYKKVASLIFEHGKKGD